MRAEELGIPQMERATLLGQFMEGYRHAVNVCGTHGKKTTTTSMIAEAMLIPALTRPFTSAASSITSAATRVGGHDTFVEACEFNASLALPSDHQCRRHQHRGRSSRFL